MKTAVRERKKERRQLKMRMEWENMRRMMATSLFFVVFFSMLWLNLIYRTQSLLPQWVSLAGWVITLLWQLSFSIYAFWWMQQRIRADVRMPLAAYWIGTSLTFVSFMIMAETTFAVTTYLFLFVLTVAMIPLLSNREYLLCLTAQLILSFTLLARSFLDWEHLAYTLAICALCGIISRQEYSAHMRKFRDGCRLSSAQNQAETDSMTRLLNRRGLERRISTIWPLCERQGTNVAIIMIDIDNFKKFNDAFGHGNGDLCIQAVTQKLIDHTPRKSDYAARVGGEEFLVFLSGISKEDTVKWARKCKESIESLEILQSPDNFLPFVTVSMGICHASLKERKEFWELRNEADRCLYLSKENGRASIYMDDSCYGRTETHGARRQHTAEKSFRWLG